MTLGTLMIAGGVVLLGASLITAVLFHVFPLKYEQEHGKVR